MDATRDGRSQEQPAEDAAVPDVSPAVRERLLRESLVAWRAQGLLSAEQHDTLLATVARPHLAQRAAQEQKLGRGVTILVNLGAIVLGAGLLVFFASNWVEFGRAAKIASL